MPRSRGTRGSVSSRCRTRSTTKHGCYTTRNGFINLLWAYKVNMRINPPGGHNHALSCNNFSTWTNNNRYCRLYVRVSGLSDSRNSPVLYSDIRLNNTPVVDDESI